MPRRHAGFRNPEVVKRVIQAARDAERMRQTPPPPESGGFGAVSPNSCVVEILDGTPVDGFYLARFIYWNPEAASESDRWITYPHLETIDSECYVAELNGAALETGVRYNGFVAGVFELVDIDGVATGEVYNGFPAAIVEASATVDLCTQYRTRCVSGLLVREKCVPFGSSGSSGSEIDDTNSNRKWVIDAVLGPCDPKTPTITPGSGSGAAPVDKVPGAVPLTFPIVRKVCPGAATCQLVNTIDANISVDTWVVKMDASGGNVSGDLPAWQAGLAFAVIRVDSSGNTVTVNAQGGETINGASSLTISSQWAGAFIESGCNSGEWFAFLTGG